MPKSFSAFSTPFLAMFQNPAELLVTNANRYWPPGAGVAAGADPPPLAPSPDFLQLPTPIVAIAANATIKPRRIIVVVVIVSPVCLYSRSEAFLSLPEAFLSLPSGGKRGSPGIEHAHVAQRVGPGHRRPGRLERRQAVRHQLSLDGVGRPLGLDVDRLGRLAVAVDGVAGLQALALALRDPGIGHDKLALVAEHDAVRPRVVKHSRGHRRRHSRFERQQRGRRLVGAVRADDAVGGERRR